MCEETINSNVQLIKERHAHKLAEQLKQAPNDKARLTTKYYGHCTFAIADYTSKMQIYLYPTPKPTVIPTVMAPLIHIKPDIELVFM
jgi:hypothetical protein